MSGVDRKGEWEPAGRISILAFWGGAKLDFRKADLLEGETVVGAHPIDHVTSVMRLPIVAITFQPNVAKPTTIPAPPKNRIHIGSPACCATSPLRATVTTAASGPIAFATSFEPWAKAIAQAVQTISTPNTRSTVA